MSIRSLSTTIAAVAFALVGGAHCAAPAESTDTGSSEASDDDELVASTSQGLALSCWAQIERPLPAGLTQPIGTQLKLRASSTLSCGGGSIVPVSYRFYIEGPSGRFSPQGTTGWTSTRSAAFDTTGLAPGRYRTYVYTLPTALVSAWQASDLVARATSVRSGYSYVVLGGTHWSAGAYDACSAACGGGTQARNVECVDDASVPVPDAYCDAATKPVTSAACNEEECSGDVDVGAAASNGSCGVLGVQGPGFTLTASPSASIPVGTTVLVVGSGVANIGVFSVTGGTASVQVLSGTSRLITLTGALPAGASMAFRTTLSQSVAFNLAAAVTLPDGYVATGGKTSATVTNTLIMCTAN